MPLRLPLPLRRMPPARALEWAAEAVGNGARVVSVRRLRGGISSAVHALTIEDARDVRRRLVLRRFVLTDWLEREPDLAHREAATLRLLATRGLPAPRLVAVDADATRTDVPAVLMTRLPGRVQLRPAHLGGWLEAMAAFLPQLHGIEAHGAELPAYRRYVSGDDAVPHLTEVPEAWRAIIARAAGPPPAYRRALIHRDYHPGNVLWARGRLTGVIDWVSACLGPPAVDAGHCRWNLAELFGVETADAFLERWLAETGATSHDPYWDIACLLDAGPSGDALRGWHDAGLWELAADEVRRRRDEYAVSLARRL